MKGFIINIKYNFQKNNLFYNNKYKCISNTHIFTNKTTKLTSQLELPNKYKI